MIADSPNSSARFLQIAGRLLLGVCAVIAFFTMTRLPNDIVNSNLDVSWQEAFCYFATHRFLAGVDYIFTYGPMAYLTVSNYSAPLFTPRLIWEIVTKILLIGMIFRIARVQGVSDWRTSAFFGLVLFLFNNRGVTAPDVFNYFFLITLTILFLVDGVAAITLPFLIPVVLITAVFSLIKLTLLPICLPVILLASVQWVQKKRSPFLSPLVGFVICWFVLWFIHGQSLHNIPDFIKGSAEITQGYSLNMIEWPTSTLHLIPLFGLVVVLCLIAFLVGMPRLFQSENSKAPLPLITRTLAFLTFFIALFIAFKHGFVRADLHTLVSYAALALANGLLWAFALPPKSSLSQTLRYFPVVATCLSLFTLLFFQRRTEVHFVETLSPESRATYHFRTPWDDLTDSVPQASLKQFLSVPQVSEQMRTRRTQVQHELDIPRIRAEVGKETVDVWSFEQGIVLLHDMNYRPRPTFQGYSVYTPYLAEKNAAFIRSDAAPQYILFKLQSIDNRLPTLDDGLALTEVLTHYRPLFTEKEYLLLKRVPQSPLAPRVVTTQKEVALDTEIPISSAPQNTQLVAFDITPSLRARVVTALWKPKHVVITLRCDDGSSRDYRLLPQMAHTPFLLNPLILDNKEIENYLRTGKSPRRVVMIVLRNSPTLGGSFYKNTATMRLIEKPTVTP